MPRARKRVSTSSLPNGDIRRLHDGATNEVVANSRDHAHLRVSNTMERPATSTRGPNSVNYQGRWREGSPGPNTGFEVIVPGRQGFRAWRSQSRLRERQPPLGPPSAVFPVPSRGVARKRREPFTMEPAYNGRSREEVLRQIAFEEPRPISRLNRAECHAKDLARLSPQG